MSGTTEHRVDVLGDGVTAWGDLTTTSLAGNWPSEAGRLRLLDEHFYQRTVQVYLGALPAVNMLALRDGSQATWGRGYNVLPIWKRRMDARCRVPTPNADVIYAMSYLDLKQDGPLVVEALPRRRCGWSPRPARGRQLGGVAEARSSCEAIGDGLAGAADGGVVVMEDGDDVGAGQDGR
jgi:hypothetical protein